MKFEEVLPALLDGKKIRRKSWVSRNCIFIKNNEIIDDFNRRLAISVEGFKANDWEIVKKKVKLRDLTEEQYDEWSKVNCEGASEKNCKRCPFSKVACASYVEECWLHNKDLYSDKFLDQEVEINNDDD